MVRAGFGFLLSEYGSKSCYINKDENTFSHLHTNGKATRVSKVPEDTVQSGLNTYKYTYMEIPKTISSPGGIMAYLDPES